MSMSRYVGITDPYLIPGTDVLKNLLGITNPDDIEAAEAELIGLRSLQDYPAGIFDRKHLLKHHAQLFQSIYVWAGKIRTVPIAKGAYRFEPPERIEPELERIFGLLRKEQMLRGLDRTSFCERAAKYYSDINVVHLFREGNGRTQRRFFEQLALQAGYKLSWQLVAPNAVIQASIFGWEQDLAPMQAIFASITSE
jgi:cell filamentation protein